MEEQERQDIRPVKSISRQVGSNVIVSLIEARAFHEIKKSYEKSVTIQATRLVKNGLLSCDVASIGVLCLDNDCAMALLNLLEEWHRNYLIQENVQKSCAVFVSNSQTPTGKKKGGK